MSDAQLVQERTLRGIVASLLWSLTAAGFPCQCAESRAGQGIESYGSEGDCYTVGHVFVCEACGRQTPWCCGGDGDELCDDCWDRQREVTDG